MKRLGLSRTPVIVLVLLLLGGTWSFAAAYEGAAVPRFGAFGVVVSPTGDFGDDDVGRAGIGVGLGGEYMVPVGEGNIFLGGQASYQWIGMNFEDDVYCDGSDCYGLDYDGHWSIITVEGKGALYVSRLRPGRGFYLFLSAGLARLSMAFESKVSGVGSVDTEGHSPFVLTVCPGLGFAAQSFFFELGVRAVQTDGADFDFEVANEKFDGEFGYNANTIEGKVGFRFGG